MSSTARVALVTGAGSGIGRSTALHLLAEGWAVVLVDVDRAALEAVARASPGKALAVTADVTDASSVDRMFNQVGEWAGGRLELLVNNAGLLFTGHFEDQPLEHLVRLQSVNNLGVALCCRGALPLLRRSADLGGHPAVVNLSSASSVFGIPSMAVYSASKFWVRGLTEALAGEWARHGIAVRSVVPPFVSTPMLQANPSHLLMRRLGINLGPDEVAKQVLIAAHSGPLHRAVSWRFKALLVANFLLPKAVMRTALAGLAGYWPVGKEKA